MGTTRRDHQKSKRGCLQCKRRRIKCDEEHPTCGYCLKKHYKCQYHSTQITLQKDTASCKYYPLTLQYLIQLLTFVDDELPYFLALTHEVELMDYMEILGGAKLQLQTMNFIHHILVALAGIYKYHDMAILDYYHISRYHFAIFIQQFRNSIVVDTKSEFIIQMCAAVLIPSYCLLLNDIKLSDPHFYKVTKDGVYSIAKLHPTKCQEYYFKNASWRTVQLFKTPVENFDSNYGFPIYLNAMMHAQLDDDSIVEESIYKSLLTALYNCYQFRKTQTTQVLITFLVHWVLAVDDKFVESLHTKDPRSLIITIETVKFMSLNLRHTNYNLVWRKMLFEELQKDFNALPMCWKSWYIEHSSMTLI